MKFVFLVSGRAETAEQVDALRRSIEDIRLFVKQSGAACLVETLDSPDHAESLYRLRSGWPKPWAETSVIRCIRCGAPYLATGQCSNHEKGCQGGRGESGMCYCSAAPGPHGPHLQSGAPGPLKFYKTSFGADPMGDLPILVPDERPKSARRWLHLRPRWFWGESPAEVMILLLVCVVVPVLVFVFRNALFRKVTGR